MKWYKLVVAYDGTCFHGWQIQPHCETVSSCMQKAFLKTFNEHITLLGASRTDAGVHALGQVARFQANIALHVDELKFVWNNSVPENILIRSLEEVHDFHPLRNVQEKTYYYHLFLKRPLPFVARYGWHWKFIDNVDWDKFKKAMMFFIGEHDFRSFSKQAVDEKTTVRRVNFVGLHKLSRFHVMQIVVKGPGFLRYQLRRMIGAALDVASRPAVSVDQIKDMLQSPADQQSLVKAEGRGLCLYKIVYKTD